MRLFLKNGLLFSAMMVFLIVFSSTCFAAKYAKYVEKGLQATPLATGGKITEVKIIIKEATGGPKTNILQLNYPGSTVLITNVSLTAKKGLYKIELLEADKPSLTLSSQDGKVVGGNGRMRVNASGAVQYKVMAKKAKNVVIHFSFSPMVTDLRVSRASLEEKILSDGTDLKLKLSCSAGENCLLEAQNMNRAKAFKNIFFMIDYNMITKEKTLGKSKIGIIKDILPPDKTGKWPVGLVFGEPPKDISISFIKSDVVDPSEIDASVFREINNSVIPLLKKQEIYR